MATLKGQVVSGVMWRFLERLGTQSVTLIVSIVLARLLPPSDFGTVALVAIFISISNILIDCGFGTALIQKKETTPLDYNSVFYLSLGFSLALYATLFLLAGPIATFFDKPVLKAVLRVLAATVVLKALNGVQTSILVRNMLFKLSFRTALLSTLASGATGVGMALGGFGVWSLAVSNLVGSGVATVARWNLVGWRPGLSFSWKAVSSLFAFSWKILASGFVDTAYGNLVGMIIGKCYTSADLAFYNKGQQFPRLLMDSVNSTIGTVSFPALSKMQANHDAMRQAMRKMIGCSCLVVFPSMIMLGFCSNSLVHILLGDKWVAAVPFMQLACFHFALWPIHSVNLQAVTALGRSDIFLKLEILKKAIGLAILFFSYRHGPFFMALTTALVAGPLSAWANAFPSGRLLNYSLLDQIHDVGKTMLACLVMAAALSGVMRLGLDPLPSFAALTISGTTLYAAMIWLLKIPAAVFLSGILLEKIRSRFRAREKPHA